MQTANKTYDAAFFVESCVTLTHVIYQTSHMSLFFLKKWLTFLFCSALKSVYANLGFPRLFVSDGQTDGLTDGRARPLLRPIRTAGQ